MREILRQIISISTNDQLKLFMQGVMPNILVSNVWYSRPFYMQIPDSPIMEVRYPIDVEVTLGVTSKTQRG